MKKTAIVAIIGRPNVGKSTLFNRIIKDRLSIVDDTPGVTRDRIYAKAHWLNREFWVVDTGGIGFDDNSLQEQISLQAQVAIDEADLIIFTTNFQDGLVDEEGAIAKKIFQAKKPVILAVNKYDSHQPNNELYDFMKLGFGEPLAISASHGIGIGELLDKIISSLDQLKLKEENIVDDAIKLAIIGRPNVGKSSLTNALLKENRVVVSDIAGTTTDATDSLLLFNQQRYVIIDTAGIRKRGKIDTRLEKYSVLRALRAIARADIVLLMIDGATSVVEQDTKIGAIASQEYKPVIIVVNKYDLIDRDVKVIAEFEKQIRNSFKYLHYAHIVFISALTGEKLNKLFPIISKIYEKQKSRIQTSVLNEIVTKAQLINQPPIFQGERLKIYYVTQVSTQPLTFVFFVNNPKHVHFSYSRFLENQIRETFDFQGIPIRLLFRQKK